MIGILVSSLLKSALHRKEFDGYKYCDQTLSAAKKHDKQLYKLLINSNAACKALDDYVLSRAEKPV